VHLSVLAQVVEIAQDPSLYKFGQRSQESESRDAAKLAEYFFLLLSPDLQFQLLAMQSRASTL